MSDKESGGDGESSSSEPPLEYHVPPEFRQDDDNEDLHIGESMEWSMDHSKILYLISIFAKPADGWEGQEGWIRSLPLLVLMYEGIVGGIFEDPDYAPCPILVSQDGRTRRVWANVSQEGKAFVDDLREKKLLNGLKLMTEDGQPVTSYQCSLFGLALVAQMGNDVKDPVHKLVYPTGIGGGPATIHFDSEECMFTITTEGGFKKESEMTECEDISYVSSPYLPACLRENDRPNNSNKHRTHEIADAGDNIQVETSEAVTLKNVHAMIAEWIPFGANQIVALNERLGALDRNQGGFFTNKVDEDPTSTNFDVPPGLTSVKILDFDFVRFINFEAEINYPNDEGIIQIEEFGMHLDMDGTIIYGMFIEAVQERQADDISVDDLSRVMVDIHQDSSEIMNDIISQHQKDLLDTVYCGDAENRPKFNLLMCDGITPSLSGLKFMDRSDREYEIKQIVGDVIHGDFVGGVDTLILGREGIVYAGPHATEANEMLVDLVYIMGKEVFLRAYFIRMFILDNEINVVRDLIATYQEDPGKVDIFRNKLSDASKCIIQMMELLGYLEDSLKHTALPDRPKTASHLKLVEKALGIEHHLGDLKLRVKDLRKLVEGAEGKLEILRLQGTSVNKRLLEVTVSGIDVNFQGLVAATASDARAAIANNVMNIIFAGNMIFDLIDRIDGDDTLGYEGVDAGGGGVHWILVWARPLYSAPGLWLSVNLIWFLALSVLLMKYMDHLISLTLNARSIRKIMNLKINLKEFSQYVKTKTIITADTVASADGTYWKNVWKDEGERHNENWGGHECPQISCLIEVQTGFLISCLVNYNATKLPYTVEEIMGRWMDELKANGCLLDAFDNFAREDKNIAIAKPWHLVIQDAPSAESIMLKNMTYGEYFNWLLCFDCGCICGNVAGVESSSVSEDGNRYKWNPDTMKIELY